MKVLFKDRREAGRKLAQMLERYNGVPSLLVLGLPRGGMVIAYEVAKKLNALLDVFVVRKLGVPGHEELAMGAIASGGVHVMNQAIVLNLQISQAVFDAVAAEEAKELERQERLYRGERPMTVVEGRQVIVIDDGLATGATMQAAVTALKKQAPEKLVVAVPVASRETCSKIKQLVDEMICLDTPEDFYSVGSWYEQFDQTTDEEVHEFLYLFEKEREIDGTFLEGKSER